jgi:hypothetical protein
MGPERLPIILNNGLVLVPCTSVLLLALVDCTTGIWVSVGDQNSRVLLEQYMVLRVQFYYLY